MAVPRVPRDWPFQRGAPEYLPFPKRLDAPLGKVLDHRRSRPADLPPSPTELGMLLWYSAKRHGSREPEGPERWQHRPSPSAGGRHPIDILVLETERRPRLYDPVAHALVEVGVVNPGAIEELVALSRRLANSPGGAVVCFAVHPDRTASRYEHAESLIWRDAGVLLGICAVVAEGIGLNFTPVGATGTELLQRAFDADARLGGVGGFVIGHTLAKLAAETQ